MAEHFVREIWSPDLGTLHAVFAFNRATDARSYQVSIGYRDRARAEEERDELAAKPTLEEYAEALRIIESLMPGRRA